MGSEMCIRDRPETLSDLINFVSFGHIFCQDLDLTILLHQDVHLAQTELYQMDIPTRALKRYECCRNFSEPFGASRSMLLAKWRTIWYDPRILRTQKNTSTHRAQPLAELSLTERSEVLRPSEARCSVRAKRGVMPRRRRRVKLGCVETRMCPN